jgi:hypothetical protein
MAFYCRNLNVKNKHLVVVFMFLKVLFLFFMLLLVQVLSCLELSVNPLLSWMTMFLNELFKTKFHKYKDWLESIFVHVH